MSDEIKNSAGSADNAGGMSNPFRRAFGQGHSLIGIWAMLNSANVTEGLGWAGFDWLLIDGEHAPVSLKDTIAHLRALGGSSTVPVVRLAWNDKVLLKQYLDAGANTLMLPHIQNAEQAKDAVSFMRYPPEGVRGVAAIHRASHYGQIPDYFKRANEELFLIVQVETRHALDNVGEIAAVEGVDAVFFGPGDLAASMGMIGCAGDHVVTQLIEDAMLIVQGAGKKAGVLAPSDEIAERHIKSGFDFVSVANDAAILFRNAGKISAKFHKITQNDTAKATELRSPTHGVSRGNR